MERPLCYHNMNSSLLATILLREWLPSRMSQSFLSCDWGTSHFRLRLVDLQSLEVRGEIKTSDGVSAIASQTTQETRAKKYAEILGGHIETLFRQAGCGAASCIISGMASSNLGWIEVPYAHAPLPLTIDRLEKRTFSLAALEQPIAVTLVSGIRTDQDLMRGEECELMGLLESNPELSDSNCCVILPGTHSKHVQLRDRRLESFVTFMTGELFERLPDLPTLRAPLQAGAEESDSAFLEGVQEAGRSGVSAGLFKIRARSIISGHAHGALSFLSGLLIGGELLSLPPDVPCYLAASVPLQARYSQAAGQIGREIHPIPPDDLHKAPMRAHRLFLP